MQGDTAARADLVTSTLVGGKYELGEEIGASAVGKTYRSRPTPGGSSVAVTLLDGIREPERRARALQAFLVASRLQHDHILPVLDFGENAGGYYVVEPIVDAEALDDPRRRPRRLDAMVALQLARQLADALAHAHDAGVVHGALTAASVRIHRAGAPRALVADFATAPLVPRTPQLIRYLAPERLAGADADVAGDVFALGLIVFEMLEGKPMFERGADEIAEPKGPFLPRFSSIAPAGVSALVARAIRRSPAARQQSMAQLRDEIDECLRRHGQATIEARDRRASAPAVAAGAGIAGDENMVLAGRETEPDARHAAHARVTQRPVAPRRRVKVAAPQDEPDVAERFVTLPAARPKAPILPAFLVGVAVGSLQTLAAVGLVLWLWPATRAIETTPTREIVSSEPGPAAVDPAHEVPATAPPAANTSSEEAVPEAAVQPAPESPDEDAAPTKAAPSNGTTGSRPTEAGVRQWLRNLVSAWGAKDMEALRALGIGDTDVEAEAIRKRLAWQTGHVSIAKLDIFIGRMYARVAFNLVASDSRGKRVAKSETYQLERLPNGSIVRRHE